MVYFIERMSDNYWLGKDYATFTNDPHKAQKFRKHEWAVAFIGILGLNETCEVTEHEFIGLQHNRLN